MMRSFNHSNVLQIHKVTLDNFKLPIAIYNCSIETNLLLFLRNVDKHINVALVLKFLQETLFEKDIITPAKASRTIFKMVQCR